MNASITTSGTAGRDGLAAGGTAGSGGASGGLGAPSTYQWSGGGGGGVLVRCQAGLNRSGLVTALILIKDGHTPEEAINTIRTHRGPDALFNMNFANWIIEEGLHFLGMSPSQQLA
jgi:hypothetical protein